jgi:hypothetical protein
LFLLFKLQITYGRIKVKKKAQNSKKLGQG